mgnify:CR=1 FL=1
MRKSPRMRHPGRSLVRNHNRHQGRDGGPGPGQPTLVQTAAELRALRSSGGGVEGMQHALVMTMGALHEGHAALIRAARERVGPAGQVVVTVFVNPLQFGPGEDYDRYPRTLEADLAVAAEAGADAVFAPDVAEVYPGGECQVTVSAGPMGQVLEGAFRPGHFDGVLTVVAKMFHLVQPDLAFFGEKDAQQLALITRMVTDLNFPVEIVPVPTVREADGLALSSRNRYLSEEERRSAAELSRALHTGAATAWAGPQAVLRSAQAVLGRAATLQPPVALDYLALVDPRDFTEIPEDFRGEAVLAVAARVGTTRLIDNVRLWFGEEQPAGAGDGTDGPPEADDAPAERA